MNGVSWWSHKVDNAYWLCNFKGKLLKQSCVNKFCQLCWRPRSVLSRNNCSTFSSSINKDGGMGPPGAGGCLWIDFLPPMPPVD